MRSLDPRTAALCRVLVAAVVGDAPMLSKALCAAHDLPVGAGLIDETLLNVWNYGGYPRAIMAFTTWRAMAPQIAPESLAADPEPGDLVVGDPHARDHFGRAAFDAVYGHRSEKVRAELCRLHPVLARAIDEDAYGRVIARTLLSPQDTELLAVAALVATACPMQLRSHVFGARRSGASAEAITSAAHIGSAGLSIDASGPCLRALEETLAAPLGPP